MRKLLLLIFSLCLFVSLEGQIIRANPFARAQVSGGYGAEMLNNGDFSSATGWGVEDAINAYIDAGVINIVNPANDYVRQLAGDMVTPLESDSEYKLTFTVAGTSGDGIYIQIWNAPQVTSLVASTSYVNGTHVITFTTGTISEYGFALEFDAFTTAGTVDNVSLKKKL